VTLDDFLPYVLPLAKGCPDVVATFNTRLAVIELCRESLVWREYQASVPTVALQTAYAYGLAAEQQACKLLSLTLAGEPVDLVDPRIGKNRDTQGVVTPYAYGTLAGFELRPAQAAALSIVTYCAVAPTLASTVLSDSLARYMEGIAQGALARILSAKDKAYSDVAGAARAQTLWMDVISKAKSNSFNGFARVTQRTAQVRF